VTVQPPFEIHSPQDWDTIHAKFAAYCQAAWHGPVLLDPKVIGADWLRRPPVSGTYSDGF
jgi:hypothetical protein